VLSRFKTNRKSFWQTHFRVLLCLLLSAHIGLQTLGQIHRQVHSNQDSQLTASLPALKISISHEISELFTHPVGGIECQLLDGICQLPALALASQTLAQIPSAQPIHVDLPALLAQSQWSSALARGPPIYL
jgi:hypothetical protein